MKISILFKIVEKLQDLIIEYNKNKSKPEYKSLYYL